MRNKFFNRKCKITFICHGATINSEENRLSDNEKYPPLNEAGEKEIERICDWLKQKGIKNDRIYSSPALRTVQSADMVRKVFKTDFDIIEELSSKKRGAWSGYTFEQIEEKFPQMLEEYHNCPSKFCADGGENLLNFNKRIQRELKKIVDENIGNRIIIVTYPEIIQSAISGAVGIPADNQAKIYIKTGSATQISYYDSWASLVYSGYLPV